MKKTHVHHHRHRHQGFTLVELLVVVTIIAVLTALGFIGIAKYRERAQVANAVNSLRQVGAAHVAYAGENHGAINTLRNQGDDLEGRNAQNVTDSFWGRLHPYLFAFPQVDNQETLKNQLESAINSLLNTSDASEMSGTPWEGAVILTDGSGLAVPIGFNENLYVANEPEVRMSAVGDPSRTIYSAYGNSFLRASDGQEYRPLPTEDGEDARGFFYLKNRQAIVCFLDGHVETIAPPLSERLFAE